MDRVVVEHYLARAAAAASVRELHAIARAVRVAHEGDPDAETVERACWAAALRVVAAPPTPSAASGPPAMRPTAARAPSPRVPSDQRARRVDWKELAAPA